MKILNSTVVPVLMHLTVIFVLLALVLQAQTIWIPASPAVTAGAGAGVATVAHFLTWKPGDEVIFRLVAALRSKWLLRPSVQKVSARCEVPTANSINDTKDEREER